MCCDTGEVGGLMWGERIEEGGPVMERALRGLEVSIGVWEMTVAVLCGPSPFR